MNMANLYFQNKTIFGRCLMVSTCLLLAQFAFTSNKARAQTITTIAGDHTRGYSGDGGAATAAELNYPGDVTRGPDGNIYIADDGNDAIRKVDASGIITTVAGIPGTTGHTGDGGLATAATLYGPTHVNFDHAGNMYIVEYNNNDIRRVDASTHVITTFAGSTVAGYSGDGGAATAAELYQPQGLAIDGSGNVFIGDVGNSVVREVLASTHIIKTIAGNYSLGAGYSGDNGPATAAQLNNPYGLTLDGSGNLYIADANNNRIRYIPAFSDTIYTIAGDGSSGDSGDGGLSSVAGLDHPTDVAFDGSGNLYITDYFADKVRIVNAANVISTYAGTGTSGYTGDGGAATAARLDNPISIAIDPSENLYISDNGNHVIRKITPAATVTGIYFTNGPAQTITVCENTATSIDFQLELTDSTTSDTDTWSVYYAAPNGSVSAAYSSASSGGVIEPTGLTYTPDPGYVGADSFIVQASNGSFTAYTTIYVNVDQEYSSGVFTPGYSICVTTGGTITDSIAGGLWSVTNTSVMTIDSSTGYLTAIAAGTDTTIYSITNACGVATEKTPFTVLDTVSVASITGGTSILEAGANETLSDDSTGGVWSSSNSSVASVLGSGTTATVTGVAAGTDTIYYKKTGSCNTAVASYVITVSSLSAGSITGTNTVCATSTVTLYDSTASTSGAWSSSNTAKATVNSSGVVYGVAGGTDTIRYIVTSGSLHDTAIYPVTVVGSPTVAAITPAAAAVCVNATTTLSDATSGGTWSSVHTSLATISTGGMVTGIAAGTDTVKYTVSNACTSASAIRRVTVRALAAPGTISGDTLACIGTPLTLTADSTGGTWSSTNTSIATVSGGIVAGISAGTDTIKYSKTNTCGTVSAEQVITVSPAANAGVISGPDSVCVGSNITLTDTVSGGSWGVDYGYASVSSGTVTGVSNGTETVIYAVSNSCGADTATYNVVVSSPSVASIAGSNYVCVGSSVLLSDATSGGTWSAMNGNAAISTSGMLTGTTAGTDIISYSSTGSCGSASTVFAVTVVAAPTVAVTAAADTVCNNSSVMLAASSDTGATTIDLLVPNSFEDNVPGTGWGELGPDNSFLSQIDAAGSSTPVISAAEDGTYFLKWDAWDAPIGDSAAIYSPAFSLSAISNPTLSFWVYRDVSAFTGSSFADEGFRVYINTTPSAGGSVLGFVPRDAASDISGSVSGTSTTSTAGWYQYTVSIPASYSGSTNYLLFEAISQFGENCYLDNITLTGQVPASGPTWSPATYLYTDAGLTIPYTTGVASDTVYAAPSGITSYTALTYSASYSNGSCAGSGSATITVQPTFIPSPLQGSNAVCLGDTIMLTDSISGGTWSASNTNASIGTDGVVTGLVSGSDTISYFETGTCGSGIATKVITINTVPATTPVTGTFTVCVGSVTDLHNTVSGGTWSSSNAAVASVTTSGAVTGITSGTSLISYAVSNTCGTTTDTATVSVAPLPNSGVVTGTDSVCVGLTSTLVDTTSGGSWISSNTSIATVGALTGIVGGVAGGNVTIHYSVTNSCGTTNTSVSFKVNANPDAGTIGGSNTVCNGSTTDLTDAAAGGTWSSDNTAVATVSTSGAVTGLSVGTANISYVVTNVCGTANAVYSETVNPVPVVDTIANANEICAGGTVTLTDDSTGGVWSSATPTIATVSTGGVVTGLSEGTAIISYNITANGCTAGKAVDIAVGVPAVVPTISGASTVCSEASTPFTDSLTGGVWSSSNISIATVDSVSGEVTGINAGLATITYTGTNRCGSGHNTKGILVNVVTAVPAITGASSLCQDATRTFEDITTGGVWSVSNTTLATIDSTTGHLATLAPGIDTISYNVTNASGCVTTRIAQLTIDSLPYVAPVTGSTDSICAGTTLSLGDISAGGSWASSNAAVANVSSAGLVLANSPGTAVISYSITNPDGCSSSQEYTVTVNAEPGTAPIIAASSLCAGTTELFTDSLAGGSWSTSNTSIASISSTGTLTAISAGSVTVTYAVTNASGCTNAVTAPLTVNPQPVAGTIAGPTMVCIGSTITLTDTASGGIWVSSNPAEASVDSVTGIVTPLAAPGSVVITYSVTNVCNTATTSTSIILNPLPFAGTISGGNVVCPGNTISLTDSATGGVWTSSDSTIAAVDPVTGVVTGMGTGSVQITYAVTTVCGTAITTDSVASNPTPQPITGITTVCAGQITTLFDSLSGGDWVSGDPLVADVTTTTGAVGGVSAGTATIYYYAGAGCTSFASTSVLVNPLPSVSGITGADSLCSGSMTTFSNITPGGIWTSSDTAVASIDTTGLLTGLAAGITDVAYTVTNDSGCSNSDNLTVTVNAITVLSPISGATSLCVGSSATLTDTASGGTWSSSDDLVAYVDPVSGDVIAESAGSAIISYTATNPSGCVTSVSTTVTVNAVPVLSAITGTDSVCVGATTTFSNSAIGGVWASNDTGIATVDSTGIVTGVSGGTVVVAYTITNGSGCTNTASVDVTVDAPPALSAISGIDSLCQYTDVLFSDSLAGGVWTSSNSAVASVDSIGVVAGNAAGTATISYTATNSCATVSVTRNVTIDPAPSVSGITGVNSVCAGSNIDLGETTAGGIWTASNTNASVDSAGIVTGNTAGIDTISYTVTTIYGCTAFVSTVDTVNALPVVPAIAGSDSVCAGLSIALTDGLSGGTWSATNANASVDTLGNVTGITGGMDTIVYNVSNAAGCKAAATTVITIDPQPYVSLLPDAGSVCVAGTLSLSDSVSGGVWASSNASATVSDSGFVVGVAAGTDTISFTYTNVCGSATTALILTVNPLPVVDVISGPDSVCIGSTITLTDDSTGGLWFISNTNAAIDGFGDVTGAVTGLDTVSYIVGNIYGCYTTQTDVITINPLPVVSAVTAAATTVCAGNTVAFTDTTTGGTWSSSNSAIASVDAFGNVTGVAAGSATISYSISSVCGSANAVLGVTVDPVPVVDSIAGSSISCAGAPVALTESATGGVWSSSNVAVATVSTSGIVTGTGSGTVTITYNVSNTYGCSSVATFTMSVGAGIPSADILPAGSATLCHGNPVNLEVAPAVSGVTFQWYINGDPISGATSAGYTTDTAGNFTVSLSNGTCAVTLTSVHVLNPPVPVVGLDTFTHTVFTGSFSTYQWYYNGTLVPGATTNILAQDLPGLYMVVVADVNGCTDTSAIFAIDTSSMVVNNVSNNVFVKVYPNPATSVLQVQASVSVNVMILSLDGKMVINQKNAATIDVSALANGMYLIQVYDENGILLTTEKFAKVQ